MIWRDKIATVVSAIGAQSMYNTARTTTPSNFNLLIYNQSQDWLCMHKPWRDLVVTTQLALDSNNKITMPDNFGCCLYVYADPTGTGAPTQYYHLNHIDVSRRYTREVTFDDTTNIRTIKFCFVQNTSLGNPYVVYSRSIDDIVQSDVDNNVKYSFFPINTMLVVAKLIMQRYYGKSANYDINQVYKDIDTELKQLSGYAINNNAPLDLTPHDSNGQPIYITGVPLDGSGYLGNRSPYPNSVILPGGA